MTRLFHPPELERPHQQDRFDPIREGERHGLSRELSLAIWKRVSEDATDIAGRCDTEQARQRFHELSARIAARGGRLRPDVGKATRVGVEINGESLGAWHASELKPRTPGRETLVEVEARRWAAMGANLAEELADAESTGRLNDIAARNQQYEPGGDRRGAPVLRTEPGGTTSAPGLGEEGERRRLVAGIDLRDALPQQPATTRYANLVATAGARPPAVTDKLANRAAVADAHGEIGRLAMAVPPLAGAAHPDRERLEREADRAAEAAIGEPTQHGGPVREAAVMQTLRDLRGEAMPDPQRAWFENRYGVDFSRVRVHAGAEATHYTDSLGANALTAGSHIMLGAKASFKTLAHEMAHVVQQGESLPLAGAHSTPMLQPAAAPPTVQFDLAVEPPAPAAVAAPLTAARIAAAIRFNQSRMSDPYVFAVIRDVIGVSRFPAVVDAEMVQAIADWQAQFQLPADGRLTERTVATLVAELRGESAVVPSLAADANRVELEAALTFNQQQGFDAQTIRIIQGIVAVPATRSWDDATIRAIMATQRAAGLHPDGMVGFATLRLLINRLTAAARFDDAIHVIVDGHHFPTANLASIRFDAAVVGMDAITNGNIATGSPQTVRVGPTTFAASYEHMVRIIGHELQHVQQRSGATPIANQHVREFLAFAWEALATDSPAMTAADRVQHANIAIGHWNAAPAADRVPHQAVRNRLDQLIAHGGVGNF